VWEKDTLIDKEHSYTITGAPRAFNGKVVIGQGGRNYGARAISPPYDTETGNQAWRWFTVPGDPAKPFEDESMAAAAKTWDPAQYWVRRRRHAVGYPGLAAAAIDSSSNGFADRRVP